MQSGERETKEKKKILQQAGTGVWGSFYSLCTRDGNGQRRRRRREDCGDGVAIIRDVEKAHSGPAYGWTVLGLVLSLGRLGTLGSGWASRVEVGGGCRRALTSSAFAAKAVPVCVCP